MSDIKPLMNHVVIITGGARRIGASLVQAFHQKGANILLHCHHSFQEAQALAEKLLKQRKHSVVIVNGDLREEKTLKTIIQKSVDTWGVIDVLVNNASVFYPTDMQEFQLAQWNELMDTNVKAPYLLSAFAYPHLKKNNGNIINIVDIHGERPLRHYAIYSMTKAALLMQTKSLAKEFGPEVRVNGISPGAILWPENEAEANNTVKEEMLKRTCLKRQGSAEDIAHTAIFLSLSNYLTGTIVPVDGGRLLTL